MAKMTGKEMLERLKTFTDEELSREVEFVGYFSVDRDVEFDVEYVSTTDDKIQVGSYTRRN
jgi:hypothetical protein